MKDINYDYYRIFYYVAKYKSLTRAAFILQSNQPNITRFMNKLEDQLNCQLMTRSRNGITLTPQGEQLYKHVSIAYQQLRQAEEELADFHKFDKGTIRIGVTETALHGLLLEKMTEFRHLYPNIRFTITNYTTPEAIDSLKKGLVDFSLVTTPSHTPIDLKSTKLNSFEEVLVSLYPLQSKNIELKDILSYPIVGLGEQTMTYDYYSSLFLKENLEWKIDIEAATSSQLQPLIKTGIGIGFVPDFIVEDDLCTTHVVNHHFKRDILLIEDTHRIVSTPSQLFIETLIKDIK